MKSAILALAIMFGAMATPAQTTYKPYQYTVLGDNAVMFFYELPGGSMAIQMNAGACVAGISYAPDNPNPQSFDGTGCTQMFVHNSDGSISATLTMPQLSGTLTGSGLEVTIAPTTIHLLGVPIRGGHKWVMQAYSTSITVQ